MISPRCVRPDSVMVKNNIGEIEDIAQYLETTIKYVSVDENYAINQEKKSGISTDNKLLIVIDMNDLVAHQDSTKCTYVDKDQFLGHKGTFTLRGDKDIIIYKNSEYTVNSVAPIKLFRGKPEYIEVLVK